MTRQLQTLLEMHTYCRPAGSATERAFIAKYVATLPGIARDIHGNWIATIGNAPVLWSCHTDTVHRDDGRQTLHYSDCTRTLRLSKRARRNGRNCLGADDTAGVFICRELLLRGIPGTYIFHYGEERGGIGSSALAWDRPSWLDDIVIAIAFDRRGTTDVITHQFGDRTASDAFAESISRALWNASDGVLCYTAEHGIYTDTAEYAEIVPECTNLSVGYAHEHSPDESLQVDHTIALLQAIARINVCDLTIGRDPNDRAFYVDDDDYDPDSLGASLREATIAVDDVLDWSYDDRAFLDPDVAAVYRSLRDDFRRRYKAQ